MLGYHSTDLAAPTYSNAHVHDLGLPIFHEIRRGATAINRIMTHIQILGTIY